VRRTKEIATRMSVIAREQETRDWLEVLTPQKEKNRIPKRKQMVVGQAE
jgi:hypothetical protein